jgi:hypothetical protein
MIGSILLMIAVTLIKYRDRRVDLIDPVHVRQTAFLHRVPPLPRHPASQPLLFLAFLDYRAAPKNVGYQDYPDVSGGTFKLNGDAAKWFNHNLLTALYTAGYDVFVVQSPDYDSSLPIIRGGILKIFFGAAGQVTFRAIVEQGYETILDTQYTAHELFGKREENLCAESLALALGEAITQFVKELKIIIPSRMASESGSKAQTKTKLQKL